MCLFCCLYSCHEFWSDTRFLVLRTRLCACQKKALASAADTTSATASSLANTQLGDVMNTLEVVHRFRVGHKRDKINELLARAITTRKILRASFGVPVFIEFWFTNPLSTESTYTIRLKDHELMLMHDIDLWRKWKGLMHTNGNIEPDMFQRSNSGEYQLFVKPNEQVVLPLLFRPLDATSASAGWTIKQNRDKSTLVELTSSAREHASSTPNISRNVTMQCVSSQGQTAAVLHLNVKPVQFRVDRVLRFWHRGDEYMKKIIPFPDLAAARVLGLGLATDEISESITRTVKCSKASVICQCKETPTTGKHYIELKVLVGRNPAVESFFLALYVDGLSARPIEIWQIYVHSCDRVDISGTGTRTRARAHTRHHTHRHTPRFCLYTRTSSVCCCFVSSLLVFVLVPYGLLAASVLHPARDPAECC